MLTTLDKCKSYLNIVTIDEDDFIKLLIKFASSTIEGLLNRKLLATEYTERHTVSGRIFTNNYPIVEVLEVNGSAVDESRVYKTYIDGYSGKVEVTYIAGYESYEMPSEIVYACTKLVAYYYKEAREDRLGIKSEKLDVMSTTYETEIPSSILNILKPYRKVRI